MRLLPFLDGTEREEHLLHPPISSEQLAVLTGWCR
jgi:hypothetical protein